MNRGFLCAAVLAACASLTACPGGSGINNIVVHRPNCQVCHMPYDGAGIARGIEEAHPGILLKCVDCHGGTDRLCDGTLDTEQSPPSCDGSWLYDKDLAHVQPQGSAKFLKNLSSTELDNVDLDYLQFINPGDFRVVDRTCGRCHEDESAVSPRSTMAHTSGEIAVARYRAGAQSTTNGLFGPKDMEDPAYDETDLCASERLEQFAPATFEYNEAVLSLGRGVAEAQDQYLVKSCLRCHLTDFGENRFEGDFRSSGCTACHMPYADDGRSRSQDPRINKQTVPHPAQHQLVGPVPVDQCTKCHYRGGRIGISFQGYRESGGPGFNPSDATFLGRNLHGHDPSYYLTDEDGGNDIDETPADVHFEAGMDCIDCHNATEMHGNGHLYADTQCVVGTSCEDCHGNARERAAPRAGGPNLEERDGSLFLTTKRLGLELEVHQVIDSITPGHERHTPLAEAAMGVADDGSSHLDEVECFTCHAGWAPSCYGCHVELDLSKSSRYQTDGRIIPGRPSGKREWVVLNDLVLMRNSHGKISPSMPAERFFMSVVGVEGTDDEGRPLPTAITEKPRKHTFDDGRSIAGFGQRAFNPHTTRRRSQFMACDRCHTKGDVAAPDNAVLLDISYGFGSQRFMRAGCDVTNEDETCDEATDYVDYALDAIQTRDHEPLVSVGHPYPNDSRPLDAAEVEAMRAVVIDDDFGLSTPIPEGAATDATWPPYLSVE